MSSALSTLLSRAAQAARADVDQVPDAELIRRFACDRDAAAFELLLWRHGPMVWGLCRRQLGHTHDAEDAFQAAFLALARHAASAGQRGAVAGWLYRVALNAARAARNARARRLRREYLTATPPERVSGDDPVREAAARDLLLLVDGEIERLPEILRAPFLLCAVQGRSQASVAAELRCPLGTVES